MSADPSPPQPANVQEIVDRLVNASPEHGLSFAELRMTNVLRLHETWHALDDWSENDWLGGVTGELGELAGLIKRLRRGEFVDPVLIGREIADVAIYLDLLAARLRIDMGAAIVEKFNAVSDEVNSPHKLFAVAHPDAVLLRLTDAFIDWEREAKARRAQATKFLDMLAQQADTIVAQLGTNADLSAALRALLARQCAPPQPDNEVAWCNDPVHVDARNALDRAEGKQAREPIDAQHEIDRWVTLFVAERQRAESLQAALNAQQGRVWLS